MALIVIPQNLTTAMARSGLNGFLAGIKLPGDTLHKALLLDPAQVDQVAIQLGPIAVRLPCGQMDPHYRQFYLLRRHRGHPDYVRNVEDGLRLCPSIAQRTQVTQGRLAELGDKQPVFEGFELLGNRMMDTGMDLRGLSGAFLFYLIDLVMKDLDKRLADPKLSREDQEALLDAFGPGLVLVDEALKYAVQRKQELTKMKQGLQVQNEDAQAELAMLDTLIAMQQNLPPERKALLDAARRHMANKQAQAKAEVTTAAPPAKAPGSHGRGHGGRIIR